MWRRGDRCRSMPKTSVNSCCLHTFALWVDGIAKSPTLYKNASKECIQTPQERSSLRVVIAKGGIVSAMNWAKMEATHDQESDQESQAKAAKADRHRVVGGAKRADRSSESCDLVGV